MDHEILQHSTRILSGHGWSWSALALAAGLLLVMLWQAYRWLITPAPPAARAVLLTLRFTWVALLLWCLWNPQREESTTTRIGQFPDVLAAVDVSQSMGMPAAGRPSAWPSVQAAARELHDALPEEARPKTAWNLLGASVRPADPTALPDPTDDQSRLGEQLSELNRTAPREGERAALFLITDGQDTTAIGSSAATAAASRDPSVLAVELRARGVSVFPVLPRDSPQPVQFARLRALEVPPSVAANATFAVHARWNCVLHAPADYDLELSDAATGQALARRPLKLDGTAQGQETFNLRAQTPGLLEIRARLIPRNGRPPGEGVSGSVAVVNRRDSRVLLVQGSLDWEFRFVRKAMSENPSVTLDALVRLSDSRFLLQRDGEEAKTQVGDAMDLLYAQSAKYDVIMLANTNPGLINEGAQKALLRLVREGGGGILFFTGNAAQSGAFRGTLMEQLLPVELEPYSERLRAESEFSSAFRENWRRGNMAGNERGFVRQRMAAGGGNETYEALVAMSLTEAGRASEIWRDAASAKAPVPPRTFLHNARALRAKAGATVLAEHPTERTSLGEPRVLMAVQRIGAGRSAFVGVDNLWRWRMEADAEAREYDRFWQQMLLWLGQGAAGDSLVMKQFHYRPGDAAEMEYTLRPQAAGAESLATTLRVTGPGGRSEELAPSWTDGKGLGRASYPLTESGSYRFELMRGAQLVAASSVVADTMELEREFSGMNLPWLRGLAEATGGQVIQADALHLIPDLLGGTRETVTESTRRSLWRLNWIFALILGLYLLELCLRRRFLLT